MVKWEYKFVNRLRNTDVVRGIADCLGSDWTSDIVKTTVELGDQGWELVSFAPRSSFVGASNDPRTEGAAWFNTEELWVFKRPKNGI
jgi:hypothetical protein